MDSSESTFRIVLVEPEIPQNTGNIGRTCVGTKCELHLVKPMGFEINDKNLKRAGLDYWPHLTWKEHDSFQAWWSEVQEKDRVWFLTTKAQKTIYEADFKPGDWLVFGRETKGLSPDILALAKEKNITIPQIGPVRSLNLATSVAIVAYEGLRQIRF